MIVNGVYYLEEISNDAKENNISFILTNLVDRSKTWDRTKEVVKRNYYF